MYIARLPRRLARPADRKPRHSAIRADRYLYEYYHYYYLLNYQAHRLGIYHNYRTHVAGAYLEKSGGCRDVDPTWFGGLVLGMRKLARRVKMSRCLPYYNSYLKV
jgi:hypothetical protein